MPIDISTINNHSTQTKKATEQKHVKVVSDDSADKASSTSASAAQDSVSLTGSALRIQALEEQVARLPIVDTQRVEEIKNSIANGTFEFNSERIAEKLIKFEKEFL